MKMTSQPLRRDIWEVANQLESYVGPDTPEPLASWLLREGAAAASLANRIVVLTEALTTISETKTVPLSEAEIAPEMFKKLNDAMKLARETLALFPANGG